MELTASFLKNITSFIGDFSGFQMILHQMISVI
jgi:hypothetical protein